jgi:hypothetical protein
MTIEDLHERLEAALGMRVSLHVTDNRRSLITSKRISDTVLDLRVHKMFLDAPQKVVRSLASFCRRPTKSNRAVIDRFIDENHEQIRKTTPKKLAPGQCITKGQRHDLDALFDLVNKRYFKGKCTAAYTWGRYGPTRNRRRSINLGNYNYETNTIRMHPVLDERFVPAYVVEVVLYHEMLHWYIPPVIQGQRRIFHSRLFRQAEAMHPRYQKSETWKERNLLRLLKG